MQPFESHLPFLLQFFQDYEISGMSWIHFDWSLNPSLASFRLDSSGRYLEQHRDDHDGVCERQRSDVHPLLQGVRLEDLFTQQQQQQFHPTATLHFAPISTCPIEFDIDCSCILNPRQGHTQSADSVSQIPINFVNSLRALWEEEERRRQERQIMTPLCHTHPPYTQSTHRRLGESEQEFKIRLQQLFLKGEELCQATAAAALASTDGTSNSQQPSPHLSQWTRQCLERQSLYQDSIEEFSQRADQFLRDSSQIELPSIVIPEEGTVKEAVREHDLESEDEGGEAEEQSQIDVQDILLTNTAFLRGGDDDDDPSCQQEHIVAAVSSPVRSSSPHRLRGYLHQVFEDSPVLQSDLLTLQMTSKQGRRKRSRRLSPLPRLQEDLDDSLLPNLSASPIARTPERGSSEPLSGNSPFSEFNSPPPRRTLGFECEVSPQVLPSPPQQTLLGSVLLSPTYPSPSFASVLQSFHDSDLGWYHSIPHYSRLEDVVVASAPPSHMASSSSSSSNLVLSSDKGRFGWLPEQIGHISSPTVGAGTRGTKHFSDKDTLRSFLSLNSYISLVNMDRILVPTFSPPTLHDLATLLPPLVHPRAEDQLMTPGDSSQEVTLATVTNVTATSTKQRPRMFSMSKFQTSSPMRSQIQTPTQTPGQSKGLGMNIRHPDQPSLRDSLMDSKEEIRGRTTVLSMELFAANRSDLFPNPKHDSIRCLCWVSLCSVAVGDNEIETKRVGLICNCSESPVVMRSLVRGSCQLPGDAQIVTVSSERELFASFIALVRHDIDPDILVGYEVQKDSWGYLIDRAASLSIPILQELSRIPTEKPSPGNENDKYGEEHESGIYVTGRMTINLWRRMRSELKLFSYTIGSVSRHLLSRSFPEFSPQQLSSWSRDLTTLSRVIRYTVLRTELNHLLIDKLDLIHRLSESSRLYGVDFYSVIYRGSQFKVEAVMLRVAHKKGFIAIAPSKRAVAGQAAMAVIPLVMEPQSNFYVDPIAVLDFQSLYPSLIIAYNLCFSTILCQLRPGIIGDEDTTGSLGVLPYPEEYVVNNLSETYHPSTTCNGTKSTPLISPSGAVFVGRDIREGSRDAPFSLIDLSLVLSLTLSLGVLPIMLKEILDTRVMIKQSMKLYTGDSDKVLRRVLDARQLALKRLANVTYGYAGAGFSGAVCFHSLLSSLVSQVVCRWPNSQMRLFSMGEAPLNGPSLSFNLIPLGKARWCMGTQTPYLFICVDDQERKHMTLEMT
jgi:hypothetical protein